MEYLEPILKLLFPFILGAGTLYFTFYKWKEDKKAKEHKEELERLEKESVKKIANLEEQRKAHFFNQGLLSNLMKMKLYSELDEIKEKIFKETRANRFMVFVAINGKNEPKRVFALYGDKEDNHHIEKDFKAVEIDGVYQTMLKKIEKFGSLLIDVLKMPKGMLKDIYYSEEVSYSVGVFINRYHLNSEDDAIVYASIATDDVDCFTQIEETKIGIITSGDIKPLIDKIVE